MRNASVELVPRSQRKSVRRLRGRWEAAKPSTWDSARDYEGTEVVVLLYLRAAAGSSRAWNKHHRGERQNPDRPHFGRIFNFSSTSANHHRELGGPPSTQLFSILRRSRKSRGRNFVQPTILPLPTNELHVRQKAQKIARTCSETHQSGDPHQHHRWPTPLQTRVGHRSRR